MFNQIDVLFNQKIVSTPSNNYPYHAYIEALLNYGPDAKAAHLTTSLWYDDREDKFEAAANTRGNDENSGLMHRQRFSLDGKTFDMIRHLHCDVFNQDKMLINGVEMRVLLVRSKDAFCLMDAWDNGRFSVQIKEATLLVRRAKISPGVLLGHANGLSNATAKYPITRVENRSFNSFNFQNFSVNYLLLYVDGVQIPSKPLQPRFTGNNQLYVDAFQTLLSGTGIHFLNEGKGINRYNYARGYFLTAFDLTPDLSPYCASHWNLVRSGSMRVEVRFEEALSPPLSIA